MEKEVAFLNERLNDLACDLSRYSEAFNLLMNHFDKLPDETQKVLDKQLKELSL